jgi:two-component system phosphate regulon response regulator PhoB
MIMTQEKARELNALTTDRLARTDTPPIEGMYLVATSQDADDLRLAAEQRAMDFFVVGMVLPAHKASAICQLLQDDQGMMPSPVFMLKKAGNSENTIASRTSAIQATPLRTPGMKAATAEHEQPAIRIKEIEIIPGRHEVKVKGKTIPLTYSEFRILQTLASKPGWVFDREKIIHAVHGDHYNCTERAVDVQVTGLRKKLGSAGSYVETVRGVGYRFTE